MNPIITDHTGVTTIIAHHEKGGARPASIRLACPVALLKGGRHTVTETASAAAKGVKLGKETSPFPHIVKHTHLNVLINFDYAGNVNSQRKREGVPQDFTAQANWFTHVTQAIVKHSKTGERYIFVRVLTNLCEPFFTTGERDARRVERAEIVRWLPSDDLTDAERATYGLAPATGNEKQDLNKEITPITFKLANVREIVIDGFVYHVTPDADTVTAAPISSTREIVGKPETYAEHGDREGAGVF